MKARTYIVLSAVALLIFFAGLTVWGHIKSRDSKRWEQNYRVMLDSVHTVQTKYGEVLYEREALVLQKKDLENALGVSKQQIREYEKRLGDRLAYISRLEAQLAVKDTLKIVEVVHDTIANFYAGHYEDSWLRFDQKFLPNPFSPSFEVYNLQMNLPLKVGLTKDYTIFVTSPCPYFSVSEIDGAFIGNQLPQATKPKPFGFGIQAGFGGFYCIMSNRLDYGPYIGFGFSYNIVRW